MNQNNSNPLGHTQRQKLEYYEKYLRRVPIKHQRCIGVTEDLLIRIKDVVLLASFTPTTVRSFVSAVLARHLKENKILYDYFLRLVYEQDTEQDRQRYGKAAKDYAEKYCDRSEGNRGSAWLHVDSDCVDSLSQMVKWMGNGCTIGSVAEAIIVEHLSKYQELIEEMKSDMFKIQSI